ncbi:MAG: ATP-binding cassette domain-containing protein [Geminicoccaceae bacterium]
MRAVQGCTFGLARGSITGLIGPNGAGKTTLFNMIAGAFAPTSGGIHQGEDVTACRRTSSSTRASSAPSRFRTSSAG